MNNMINYPFSQVTIYELCGFFPSSDMKTLIVENLKFTNNNNELQVTIIYKTSLDSPLKLYVEIEPIYDIKYINAKADIKDIPSSLLFISKVF